MSVWVGVAVCAPGAKSVVRNDGQPRFRVVKPSQADTVHTHRSTVGQQADYKDANRILVFSPYWIEVYGT